MRLLMGGFALFGSCVFLLLAGSSGSVWGLLVLALGVGPLYLMLMSTGNGAVCSPNMVTARLTLATYRVPISDIQLLCFEDAFGRFNIVTVDGEWISVPFGARARSPNRVSQRVTEYVSALRIMYGKEVMIVSGSGALPNLIGSGTTRVSKSISRPSRLTLIFLSAWLVVGVVGVCANAS